MPKALFSSANNSTHTRTPQGNDKPLSNNTNPVDTRLKTTTNQKAGRRGCHNLRQRDTGVDRGGKGAFMTRHCAFVTGSQF